MAKKPEKPEVDQFAYDRSHKASESAYDLGKATGQACLLINGGAATAVLALLAKEKIDPFLVKSIAFCLTSYVTGMVLGSLLLYSAMMRAESWNYFWYFWSYLEEYDEANKSKASARFWEKMISGCYYFSMLMFMIGSSIVGFALLGSK
jgi:hypothetical protein